MVAILNGKVDGSEPIVMLSAFVDESGTGDEPNVVLAAVMSNVEGWITFNPEWQRLLDENRLDYAHFKDLRKGCGQYEGWSINQKERFSRACMAAMKQHCIMGFTVSLNKQLYAEKYRDPCRQDRISPDSAYALCAREVFGWAARMTDEYIDYRGPINFVFESGHRNAPNAAAVFADLKAHSDIRDRLGFFALEDKKKLRPLQAADQIAHQARRSEAEALKNKTFTAVDSAHYVGNLTSVVTAGCPFFYFALDEEMLEFHRQQQRVLRGIKRRKASRQTTAQ